MGTALWGRVSETRLGRRGAICVAEFAGCCIHSVFCDHEHFAGALTRSLTNGRIRYWSVGDGPILSHRAVSYSRSSGRPRLFLSCRRRCGIANADLYRNSSGPWGQPIAGNGSVHRSRRCAGLDHDMDGAGDQGTGLCQFWLDSSLIGSGTTRHAKYAVQAKRSKSRNTRRK